MNIPKKIEKLAEEQETTISHINDDGSRYVELNEIFLEGIEIQQALDMLPPKLRIIIGHRYKRGYSINETAELLGIHWSTVEKREKEAMRILKNELKI